MFTLLAGGCPAPPNPVLHAYLSAEKVGGFYGLNRGTGVIYEHCIICVIAVWGIMYAVFKDQRISHFRVNINWAKLMYARFAFNGDHPGLTTTNTRHAHPDFHQDLHEDGEYCVE
ncbi:hypothetical protein GTR04_2124 [Trichophyton interdigitale]|uniref:Uncharacterized protein n=2 Tax=Trichophyton interdigitale TaxID=101480 RepID=A0A9P4YJ18_9EURO|nr:hypothetical protein GY631_2422 [Trichophyton interdigitale]KAF3898405.1 hypothetical protein GY632_1795 [Trichophyton interdigitale]KAG8210463.1 hypothetical protein GTR04_2124 [Trichophyton interdigitale]KDB24458.1 hypothetical protein H109_03654 [Trichophyton interdigitale MR816]